MGIELTFEISFQSNYHIGAGYGKGFGLDSALLREANGMLVLRGSTITGLLRDATYRLLSLTPMQKHNREKTLERLFGAPTQAKRWYIASAHPVVQDVRNSQIVQHVRIDPYTRRAEPRKLFSQEEGHAGQVFRFTVTCAVNDDPALDEAALLVAAARNIRQLGRSRRRGLGECVIHLTDVAGVSADKPVTPSWENWFLNRFDNTWLKGNPAPVVQAESKTSLHTINVANGAAVRVRVVVRLDEPLLIAGRAQAGKQFDSRPYIHGGAVLGALAGLAAERCDLSNPDQYHDFVALFLRGGITFQMLYPAHEYRNNLYPTIPASLGLMTCSVVPFGWESAGHSAYPAGQHKVCPQCESRLEPVSGFAVLKRAKPYTILPSHSSEMHIQINEETQQVEKGQLYGYTVLDAGQYFVGELRCTDESAWERLKEMTAIAEKTPLTWHIGKARRRGYGKVTAWLERCDDHPHTWVQLSLAERIRDLTQSLSLTLLTDTIIADPWGRQATGFTPEWLETALGLGPLTIEDAYARTRVVDSFNSHLGLPRWRDTALTAGSVVWFKIQSPPDDWQARLQKLESEGVGLRRNEGFGRVAFNHPVYDLCQAVQHSAIPIDREMWLSVVPGKDTFVENWEKELEKLPSKLDPRFAALARWLQTHSDESPENLLSQLDTLGQPDSALIEAIGGQDEYGARSKDNFFTQKGKDGVQAVRTALEHLKTEDRQNWSRGIERLADWITALTRDKEGGTQ